jgi:hypothetical protein
MFAAPEHSDALRDEPPQASLQLRSALERALACDTPSVARLAHAHAVVRFEVAGGADEAVTLLLDRQPPRVASGDEPADVVIELSAEQAARFLGGRLPLPSAVVAGQVPAYGAVRKYLAVDPILRDLLARASQGDDATSEVE